jgi:uncharacterized protein
MDRATAVPVHSPEQPLVPEVPPIGVASIPAPPDRARPPAPVPAMEPAAADPPGGSSGGVTAPGFSPGVSAKLRSYVYLLVDPRTGRPFYVGRGRNDRCFRHVNAAGCSPDRRPATSEDRSAKYPMLDRIREIEAHHRSVRIDILRHGLSADEALLVEAATHDALGLPGRPGLDSQRRSAVEVSSLLAKRAKIKRSHQLVLLRVGAAGTDTSYDRVRHDWRIGRRWTDPGSPRSPRWAAIVAGDVVASVYKIEGWEAHGARRSGVGAIVDAELSRSPDRFCFAGAPDPELEDRYTGKSVAAYQGAGSKSPVTYVWCGPHWVNTPA